MDKERYEVNRYLQRDKSSLILAVEKKTNVLMMQLVRPSNMHLKSEEVGDALYRYFNTVQKNRILRQIRKCVFNLPEEYMSIIVCRFLTIKVRPIKRKDSLPDDDTKGNSKDMNFDDSTKGLSKRDYDDDERGPEYIEFTDDKKGLSDYAIARLCRIDGKIFRGRWENIQIYLRYLWVYLKYKKQFDFAMKEALAPRGVETRELELFKDLLLNPFQPANVICKKYRLKKMIKSTRGKKSQKSSEHISESTVRQYVKRFSKRIITKARKDKKLAPDLLRIHYSILRYFRNIFSAKATKKFLFKIRRVKHHGVIICEDRLYDLIEKESTLFDN